MSTATMPELTKQEFVGQHHQQLAVLRDSSRRRRLFTACVTALVLVVVGLGSIATLDYFFELQTPLRALTLLTVLSGTSLIIWAFRQKLHFESTDAAVAAEQAWPELGQRIRTSHDYAARSDVAHADPQLIAALEQETDQKTVGLEFETLAPRWPVWTASAIFGTLLCIWVVMLLLVPESQISTARAMLIPVNYTEVEVNALPDQIARDADLEVKVDVSGRPLESAAVLFRPRDSRDEWSRLEMQPTEPGPLKGTLLAVIPKCQDDFELRIEAGPELYPVQQVSVQAPLLLEEMIAAVEPPAYTNLPATEGPAERLRLPAGSNLTLSLRYNRAPHFVEPELKFENAEPLWRHERQDELLTVSLENLQESLELTIRARAEDGITHESPRLRIRVIPDEAPLVRFHSPDEQAEAIPTEEVRFAVEASDDYGLSRIGIRYKIGNGTEQTLWEESPSGTSNKYRHTAVLSLEELQLTYHDAISYYAVAEDNREPETQKALSELRFLDIRPFSREYEFREGGQCNCSGECLTLEKLITEQRGILQRTFSSSQRNNSGQGAKLAAEEQALQAKTESLIQALTESGVGPIPPLENAVVSMMAATAALEADQIASGLKSEEMALARLVEARQNLRRILKQSNSQSQATKQADRQEMQKLRPPERKPQQQEQKQLAELRKEMEKLAKQQRSFSKSASQCSNPSSSQSSSQGSPQEQKDSQQNSDAQNDQQMSREDLVKQQQEAAEAAKQLQQKLAQGKFGELAPERMQRAAESIEQSGHDLEGQHDQDSIAKAERAADELERLSQHLGERHAPDFGERLGHAQRQAEQLASEQRDLSEKVAGTKAGSQSGNQDQKGENSGNSSREGKDEETQKSLADRAEELADLISQLEQDSGKQDWSVQRKLSEELAAHSPDTAAAMMQDSAEELEAGKTEQASRSSLEAAEELKGLAAGLRDVQSELGKAQLEQLLTAEELAAELLRKLERADSRTEQFQSNNRVEQFAESLKALARGDKQLASSLQNLKQLASQNSNSEGATTGASDVSRDDLPQPNNEKGEFNESPRNSFEGLRVVDRILQRRIQEAILDNSLQQSDQAVPPKYQKMVEDYYRTLSEDIE